MLLSHTPLNKSWIMTRERIESDIYWAPTLHQVLYKLLPNLLAVLKKNKGQKKIWVSERLSNLPKWCNKVCNKASFHIELPNSDPKAHAFCIAPQKEILCLSWAGVIHKPAALPLLGALWKWKMPGPKAIPTKSEHSL